MMHLLELANEFYRKERNQALRDFKKRLRASLLIRFNKEHDVTEGEKSIVRQALGNKVDEEFRYFS